MYPGKPPSDVIRRVLEEYNAINSTGTGGIFIMLENMMETCSIRSSEIIYSSDISGLYISYLLGLTEIDPIKEGTDMYISSLVYEDNEHFIGIIASEEALIKAEEYLSVRRAKNAGGQDLVCISLSRSVLLDMVRGCGELISLLPEKLCRDTGSVTSLRKTLSKANDDNIRECFDTYLSCSKGAHSFSAGTLREHLKEYRRLSGGFMSDHLMGRTVWDLEDIREALEGLGATSKQIFKVICSVILGAVISGKLKKKLLKLGLTADDIEGLMYMSRLSGRGESASFFLTYIRLIALRLSEPEKYFRLFMEKISSGWLGACIRLLERGEAERAQLLLSELDMAPIGSFEIFMLRDMAMYICESGSGSLKDIMSAEVAGYIAGCGMETADDMKLQAAERLIRLGLPASVISLYREGIITVSDRGRIREATAEELRLTGKYSSVFCSGDGKAPEPYHIVRDPDCDGGAYHILYVERTSWAWDGSGSETTPVIYSYMLPSLYSSAGEYEETAFCIGRQGGLMLKTISSCLRYDDLPF